AAAHGTRAAAQPLTLAPLAVPNTLSAGALDANKQFAVEALDVTGAIAIDPGTGFSESDFYSWTGKAGDLVTIEALSKALTRLGGNTIDPILRVYDAGGNLVAFYGGSAVNDDQFEPTDSGLLDLRLPADGTYTIEVDTFTSAGTPDVDTGQYELLVYH